ncbi:unnamed protein product [Adineta steineri]|uniref:ATPase AAA-type core domain-containing protein n=1 Tax=Adineta steineri TaxID=433720 RepID=A0A815SES4_9BILA|nr:unnamed protein product [Adineta steineri]CAF1641718.1 unnamed protein product [Adineta steineri]
MSDAIETRLNEPKQNSMYVGALPNISMESLLQFNIPSDRYGASSIRLFLGKYHALPCILHCTSGTDRKLLHVTTMLNYLRDELKHDLNTDLITGNYNVQTNQMDINARFCDLKNGIMLEFHDIYLNSAVLNPNQLKADNSDNGFSIPTSITIYYLPHQITFVPELCKSFYNMTLLTPEPTITFTLQMVCRNQCGYYLNSITIKKPLITDLALYYGNDFVSIHEKIIKSLNTVENKGIVLLHGIPGSGKTHYIRYLIHEIQGKTLIYVPPDMAKEISSPDFLPFLMQYPDSILIIEDAENIIKDRNESSFPSQAVANLLNLSDGLLGDAMHQQIVATFNCDLTTIDPALLRKGRLIANYEFNKLDLESSKILSEKLGFGTNNITKPMTLAEIYNQND